MFESPAHGEASPALLMFAAAALAACAPVDRTGTIVSERDSAGIAILEITGEAPELRARLDTVARLGVIEGDSSQQFHRIVFAATLADDRVVVVDRNQHVRWFDRSGVHERRYGRTGDGPGEFRLLSAAFLGRGDTLVVYDARNRRVAWLSGDGRLMLERRFEGGLQLRLVGGAGGTVAAVASQPSFDMTAIREYNRLRRSFCVRAAGRSAG